MTASPAPSPAHTTRLQRFRSREVRASHYRRAACLVGASDAHDSHERHLQSSAAPRRSARRSAIRCSAVRFGAARCGAMQWRCGRRWRPCGVQSTRCLAGTNMRQPPPAAAGLAQRAAAAGHRQRRCERARVVIKWVPYVRRTIRSMVIAWLSHGCHMCAVRSIAWSSHGTAIVRVCVANQPVARVSSLPRQRCSPYARRSDSPRRCGRPHGEPPPSASGP